MKYNNKIKKLTKKHIANKAIYAILQVIKKK